MLLHYLSALLHATCLPAAAGNGQQQQNSHAMACAAGGIACGSCWNLLPLPLFPAGLHALLWAEAGASALYGMQLSLSQAPYRLNLYNYNPGRRLLEGRRKAGMAGISAFLLGLPGSLAANSSLLGGLGRRKTVALLLFWRMGLPGSSVAGGCLA